MKNKSNVVCILNKLTVLLNGSMFQHHRQLLLWDRKKKKTPPRLWMKSGFEL